MLRPAGRILRADIACSADGRSKGWGTAVFATPQEAQHAINTFDGWEVDGRVIKVRWDKYQGSPGHPSPQLSPATGLSSPQVMRPQLSPSQTTLPGDYVALAPNQGQPNWQPSMVPAGPLRQIPPIAAAAPLQLPQPLPLNHAQSQFAQGYQFQGQSPSQNPSTFTGVVYNPSGGWYTSYAAHPVPATMGPQIQPPTPAGAFNMGVPQHPLNQMNGQHQDPPSSSNSSHKVFAI